MKVQTALKRKNLLPGEILVKRNGRLRRVNKKNPRRNARQK